MGIDDTVKAKPAPAPVPAAPMPAQPAQPTQQIKAANPVRTGPAQFRQDISKGIVSPKPVASPYFKPPTRGFWENPQRVARYHNLIRTAPPGWKAPDWLNPAAINEAYDYMRFRNNFKPVEEWQYLPDDDPGSYFLKDLTAPPNEFLLPGEYGYKLPTISTIPTQEQINAQKPVDWESLPLYQQILIAALTPEAGLEGRPEWTRATAAAGQALLAAPAGAAIGQMVGGPWLAGGLGLLTFGGTFYQAYANKEIPGLNDFLQLMDTGAIFAERVIGLGKITGEKGLAELLRVLPEAYKASSLTYETQQTDLVNKFGPAISAPLDWMYQQGWIDEPGGWTRPATEGEVWQFQEGFTTPQPLEGERGVEALLDAAERIRSGEKYDDVYADYVDRFGFTGTLNDFIMQTAIDPANLAPGLGGKAGEIVSRALGNERAAQAFRVNQGSLIIDALPFPLQPIATAVTGLQGAKGVTASWKTYKDWIQQGYYPATMFDMPTDMRTQFNKLVDTGIDPKAIQVSGNKMLWTDKAGKAQEFVGSRQVMIDIPEMEQLSNFEQFVGEVDLTYGIKDLKPSVQKSGIARLMSLDPASQSHVLLNVYHQVVSNLFNRAHGDPMVMGKMIKQLMGQEQIKAGDPGEMVLKSPAARAVRDSVRAAANTAGFEKMLTDWQMVAGSTAPDGSHIPGRRDILLNIANALQRKPAMILEQLQTNPAVLMAEISDKTQITGDPEFLKKTLGVFIGDDALPWNEQQFEVQLVNSIADKMGEYMQKVYGLKPDKAFFRMAQTLKSIQSLVLLNFNPAYFLNNEVNNLATRAATGVFGYMTQGKINKYWDRMGVKPPRLDVGASPGDEGATYRPDMISRLKESNDALGKAQKVVSQVTRKLGLFSKLSANFESMESAQAFTIGSKQFMGRSWKRGKGFRKMHPAVERVLNQNFPGMVEVLYSAAEGGLNMQEINDRILGDYVKPSMRASAQAAAAQVFPNMPDVGMDLLEKSGVLDAIESRLDKATTPEEVDAVRRTIESDMRQIISEKWAGDMIAAAEHARTLVEAERIPAVRELMVQYIQRQASMWLNQRREWDHLYSMRDQLTADQWSMQVENLFNQQDQEWRSHYKVQNQVYDGIAKALSINTQANMDYLAGLAEVSNTWTKFHEDARKLRSDFFRQSKRNSGEKYEDYIKRSSRLWNTLQDTLDELYQKHAAVEDRVQIKMDSYLANGFAVYTGWNPVRVQAWRAYIRALRSDMVRMQREHRRKTRNMTPEERDTAYADFNPVYNKLIADMHRAEIVGAAWIRTRPVNSETLQSAIAEIKKMVKGEEGKAVGITEPEPAVAPDPNAEFITERGEGQVQVSMEWLAVRDAAIAAGMIDKSGNVPTPFLLNVINVHLRSNGLPEVTRQNMYNQSPDVVLKAIQEHVERNQGERKRPVKKQAEVRTALDDIAKIAELDKREAYIKQKSMLTRRDIIERFHQIPNISPEQIDAAMLKLDMVADQYARRMGYVPSEATRDAYYATRIADVITAFDNPTEGQQQASFYDYLGQLPGDEVIGELYQDVKGSNILQTDGRSLLIMGETADFSTIMHELGHIWRRDLSEADLNTLAKLGGLKDGAELRQLEQAFYFGEAGDLYKEWRTLNQQSTSPEGLQQAADVARLQQLAESPAVIAIQKYVDAEETFTRGLERYLTEGFAPTPALRSLYKRFTDWMLNIYKTLYKKNGRVYGFESGDLSVNITAQVNGVSLRDILDRMFTGEVRRTPTFEILVQGRLEYNQRIPRNINVPLSELTRRARREIVKEVLSSFASIDQAIDYATSMDADVFVTETGIELDAADLYDAIQVVQNDPLYYDPFAARKQEVQYAAVAQSAVEELIEQAVAERTPEQESIMAAQLQAIQARKEATQASFDSGAAIDFDAIEALGLQLTAAPVVEGVQPGVILPEGDMPAGLHVHRLTAGRTEAGQEIVAVVYNGDLPVALIPAGNETGAFDTAHGQGRVLGLDPYNPNNWVIEREGEITVFDPNNLDVKGSNGEGLYQTAPQSMRYDTPEFKAWFKDSALVDENGKPLDLYHGTTRIFDQFSPEKIGSKTDAGWFGAGFYFTPDPELASGYAVGYDIDNWDTGLDYTSGAVMPVHLSIQKPFDFRSGKVPEGVEIEQGRFGIQPNVKETTPGAFRDALIREGYDGVFVYEDLIKSDQPASDELYFKVLEWYRKNRPGVPFERSWLDASLKKGIRYDYAVDYYGEEIASQLPKERKLVEVVAFFPEQIKSKFNRGSWGRQTGNLLQQTAPTSQPYNPIGDVQPGSVPSPEPAGAITHEAITEYMNPLVNRMFDHYKTNMNRRFKVGDLDPVSQKEVRAWLNQVDNDLSSTKLAATRYGEQMRDFALLNYSRRYGFDNYLSIGFPYIFWYMRTMMNWGARAFDRPAWFAMYARLRRKQEEQERKGMPSRLRGKVRMPMSWLPDWMGGGIYVDPMKQLFPPAQFGAPLDYAAQQQNQLQRRTEQVLRDMVEQDVITSGEMDEALSTQAGSAWERAFTQAKMETEIDDSPMSLAGMMMQPALWWTIPSKLASGKGEELSPLPVTRFGQSVRTALQDTPLEAAGNLAGAIFAGPEEAIREKAGLSKYGEWGDYYVDRMLANLAADGDISAEEAQTAMIERRGPAYDLAIRQVEQEMMLRTPGTLPILAIKEGAHPVEVAAAVIASLFPAGLFPTGELKMRGLAAEYNAAWKRFDAGNEEAINQFFEDHPEYEARLALYDEPEERLRQFLVSEIWDRYTSLERMNRKRAGDLLGEEFEQSFLDKDTRSYDSTDIKQLATWAQMLGGMVPQVEQTTGVEPTGEPLDLYTPQEISAVDAYYQERDELYPMATAWQSAYYSLPAGAQRKAFLQSHPQLKKYWDWNSDYKAEHPEIQPYLNENAEQRLNADVNDLSAPLTRQLIAYYFMGKEMTSGGKAELNRIWVANGSKGGSMEEYMQMLVRSMFGQ